MDPFKLFFRILMWPLRALTPSKSQVNAKLKDWMYYGWPVLMILFGLGMAATTQRPDWHPGHVAIGLVIATIGGYWLYRRCGGKRLF